MLDQDEIIFRRFSEAKQAQVRQLVGWARLLGLTGRDLISIGGKLDRATAQQELRRNKEIAQGMWNRVKRISLSHIEYHDPDSGSRYEIKVVNTLLCNGTDVIVWCSSPKETKFTTHGTWAKFTTRELKSYHCGTSLYSWIYCVLVNIHYGDLKLPG